MRFSLRAKLALVALVLLVLPWAGARYVNEVERFLLEGEEQTLLATARAVATALHERPQLLEATPPRDDALRREAELELRQMAGKEQVPLASEDAPPSSSSAEITEILRGVQRTSSRLWVVNSRYQVLALAGSLRRRGEAANRGGWWQTALGWLVEQPTEDFRESLPDEVLATGREIAGALQGTPGIRRRRTPDGRAVVISAAYPIWSGNDVVGAVVAEETTNPILSLKSRALERLLLFTLIAFTGAAALLFGFASRLSGRIRRLRDEAESAIDAGGRITRLAAGSRAGDEIGDLSRSFSAILERLAQHQAYLESMAGRLSHELRTPMAVVRSSLENLKLGRADAEAQRYIDRAEDGLGRLNRVLERMTEASRLEQSLRASERERYDLVPVVRGCVEGYRLAYPATPFALELPARRMEIEGSPDLAAQMLDKLAENAVDFSRGGAVRVVLAEIEGRAVLSVSNEGELLPAQMQGRLFGSMISVREKGGGGTPHLGLGLYVARLIAEFHGGSIEAANLPAQEGVVVTVRVPLAWK